MFDQPEQVINYPSDEVLIDAVTGVSAFGLIFVLALFLGGFSFFSPWMIVTPPILFIAGLVRARSKANVLLKGLVISLPSLVIAALLGNYSGVGVSAPFVILPCLLGIWIRRRRRQLGPK